MSVPQETPISRDTSLRKGLPHQNVSQIEVPWEGVTLNRCLFIAITILVITSGCQRLNEVVRGHKDVTEVDTVGTVLNMRHTAARKAWLPPPQSEASLWDTFFWWVSDDDEEESRRGKSRKTNQEKSIKGLRHKAIPKRNLLRGRDDRFKARREKGRRNNEEKKESVKGRREMERRLKQKKLEEEEHEVEKEEEKEKIQKKSKENKKKDAGMKRK
ncbi:nucleolar protein 58-like [Hoplias malabaricus]|uniref:nucleolar protein 58-like n=1 Tax=Hoplias malabaricus TaxID=27720 RepID=UPI0034618087